MPVIARKERWAYAMGDTGFNFAWATIELYLLFYYIRILELDPHVAATIFLVGAALDIIIDPLVGIVVDRTSHRLGARRWVLLATPALGMTLAAAFLIRGEAGTDPLLVGALHLALRISYSLGNVPYSALPARMTTVASDQVRLTATRMQGAAIGGLTAAGVYFALPLEKQAAGMPLGVIILALLSQPILLISMLCVRQRVSARPAKRSLGQEWRGFARLVVRHRITSQLLALVFVSGMAITITHKSILFVFDDLGSRRLGYAVAMVPAIALLVAAPVFGWLANRFDFMGVFRWTAVVLVFVLSIAAMSSHAIPMTALFLTAAVLAGAGISTLFWSIVPLAISHLERQVDDGVAGRLAGLVNLSRKLAQAVVPPIVVMGMEWGYSGLLVCCVVAGTLTLATSCFLDFEFLRGRRSKARCS